MNRGQLPTNQIHDINWGALDHASRAPQLNYNVCVCLYVCVFIRAAYYVNKANTWETIPKHKLYRSLAPIPLILQVMFFCNIWFCDLYMKISGKGLTCSIYSADS